MIEPNTEAPYKTLEHPQPFTAARAWLERLGTTPLSQVALAQTWVALDEEQDLAPLESAWLDGGFETRPRHLRESSPGLTVLLPNDAAAVESGAVDPVRVRIPMNPPRGKDWQKWREVAFARVPPADRIVYHSERGAQWKN